MNGRRARIHLRRQGAATSIVAALLLAATGCRPDRERSLAQLASADARVRVTALERLADSAIDADLPALAQAARDPKPEVRRAAVLALGKRAAPAAIDRLGEALADPDPTVQRTAISALAASDDERARSWLYSAFGRRGPEVREAIVSALGRRGVDASEVVRGEAQRIWQRDLDALEKGSLAERTGAAEELGRSGRPEVQGILGALLSNESALVAAAAARGLGAAGDPNALPHLVGLLGDPSPAVRDAAADALGALGDPRAIDPLVAMALSGGASALQAARALARLPGSESAACEAARAVQDGAVIRLLLAHAKSVGAACDIGPSTDGAVRRDVGSHAHADPEETPSSEPVRGPREESRLDALLRRVGSWRGQQATKQGEPEAHSSARTRALLFHDRPEVRADAARLLAVHPDPEARVMLEALAAADYFVEVRRAAAKAVEALRSAGDTPR